MLTDEQWLLIQPLLPPPSEFLRGRPPLDDRLILDAILWKFSTRSPWYDMPESFPSHQTCYRRYLFWQRRSVWNAILAALYEDLCQRGNLDPQYAVDLGLIQVTKRFGQWDVRSHPTLEGSWQLSTALIFIGLALQSVNRHARQ
jgi:transposase